MKCAWCGQVLREAGWSKSVGQMKTCDCIFVNGKKLAVPQLGSSAYEKVMADQEKPDWKPLAPWAAGPEREMR